VFVRNIRTAKSQVELWLQVAPQRDNIWGLRDLLRFAREEGVDIDLANILQWPPELSVASLPAEEKRRATGELTELIEQTEADGRVKVAHELAMLRSYLNTGNPDA
jgi:hypothetical protein